MINKQIKLYTRQELSKNIQYFMRYSRFYHIRKSSKIRISGNPSSRNNCTKSCQFYDEIDLIWKYYYVLQLYYYYLIYLTLIGSNSNI